MKFLQKLERLNIRIWMGLRRLFPPLDTIAYRLGERLIAFGTSVCDGLDSFTVQQAQSLSAEELLQMIYRNNQRAVDRGMPKPRHPLGLVITCMDSRINISYVVGDVRSFYDRVQLPGTVLPEIIIETARLAVLKHQVKVILVIEHTDCAMQKVADGELDVRFKLLTHGVRQREVNLAQLIADPVITAAMAWDGLIVTRCLLHTDTGLLNEIKHFYGIPTGNRTAQLPDKQ